MILNNITVLRGYTRVADIFVLSAKNSTIKFGQSDSYLVSINKILDKKP